MGLPAKKICDTCGLPRVYIEKHKRYECAPCIRAKAKQKNAERKRAKVSAKSIEILEHLKLEINKSVKDCCAPVQSDMKLMQLELKRLQNEVIKLSSFKSAIESEISIPSPPPCQPPALLEPEKRKPGRKKGHKSSGKKSSGWFGWFSW